MARLAGSLDTSVLVRLLTGDIPELETSALALINSGKDFLVSDTSLIEATYALNEYYKVPRQQVAEAILELTANPHFQTAQIIFEEVFKLYEKQPALSVEDCYLAVKAKADKGSPLWTFDKKLAQQSAGLAQMVPQKALG